MRTHQSVNLVRGLTKTFCFVEIQLTKMLQSVRFLFHLKGQQKSQSFEIYFYVLAVS